MPKRKTKPRGITNKQASYLADLQSAVGEPFTGRGMSMERAATEIERVIALREAQPRKRTRVAA